jgi:hypothetical protein
MTYDEFVRASQDLTKRNVSLLRKLARNAAYFRHAIWHQVFEGGDPKRWDTPLAIVRTRSRRHPRCAR